MEVRALTIRGNGGILNSLRSDVGIATPHLEKEIPHSQEQYMGIWDTGASASVITPKVVVALGLKPTGAKKVHAAGLTEMRPTYLVDIQLPTGIIVQSVEVTEATLTDNDDVLIGMDIITLGDFSITNVAGITVMSFRIPSVKEIDYVKESQSGRLPLNRAQRRHPER